MGPALATVPEVRRAILFLRSRWIIVLTPHRQVPPGKSVEELEPLRGFLIATIAFVTVVDLFATQALLPGLARAYNVSPAAAGIAVNATAIGMALASLLAALFSRYVDRRHGIVASLVVLCVPTALLSVAPDLATFAALRVAQGLCMACGFTLALAYLGEHCSERRAASAFAAYVAGNVASNLIGRLFAAGVADELGLSASFLSLAAINLAGAAIATIGLTHRDAMKPRPLKVQSPLVTLRRHLGKASLRAAYVLGFCILFAFIGIFTFVNFTLAREPIALSQRELGLVYLVFLPSIATTSVAGRAVALWGERRAVIVAVGVVILALPLLLSQQLTWIVIGLMFAAAGTFFAQAIATGFVARVADGDRGSASGLYLAFYFSGGIVGSIVLGLVYDRFGWAACVAAIALALVPAILAGARLCARVPDSDAAR